MMAQPTQNDLHPVDPILTGLLHGYMNDQADFVADRALVPVPVTSKSGTYFKFDKKYWFSDEMVPRAPGAPYARTGYGVSTDTYKTEQWALAHPIADEDRAASQLPLDLETAGVEFLGAKGLIRKERMFAAAFMATGKWATDNTTATDWDDTSSDPVTDMQTARRTVRQSTGKNPNVAVMGEIVKDALLTHPDIIDRIKYTQAATAATVMAALAAIFEVSQILVAGSLYNSANEAATEVMAPIIDDDCLVFYRDASAGIFKPTAAKMFHWAPGGGLGGIRPLFRDGENDADLLKYKMQIAMEMVANDLGYFFSDIV
jgi:hypothetical protein